MFWWRCAFHCSPHMPTVSVSSSFDRTTPTHIPCKIPPTLNQASPALMNEVNLFLNYGSLTIYKIFSRFSLSAGTTLIYEKFLFLARINACIFTFVQSLARTTYSAVPDRSVMEMALASCSNWLQTGQLEWFVALSTIGAARNRIFQTLYYYLEKNVRCSHKELQRGHCHPVSTGKINYVAVKGKWWVQYI